MTEPTRASNIPAEAIWVPERNEFRLSRLVDGQADGEVRWFRADGSLAGVSMYAAGKGEGPYERFHQDGTWSQRGQQRNGNRDGLCRWRRTDTETTEGTLPPSVPAHVREAQILYQDGLPGPGRYYDADGVERRVNGELLPPRPANVDERAGFSEDDGGGWFFGLGAQDPKTRHGTWRWWFVDGIERQTHEYREGRCIARIENHRDGTPKLRSCKDARGWDLVQRCFDEGGREVGPFGAELPPRPEGLPADAVFDSCNNRWVAGLDLSSFPPMGEITLYELDGPKDETLVFADGQLRRRVRYTRDGKVLGQTDHDERGREILDVLYWAADGTLRHRVERTFDGAELVALDVTTDDRVMRGRKGEVGLDFEFVEDGKVVARGAVADKRATGIWEFIDDGQTHRVDLTGRKLRAEIDPDFDPAPLLGVALLNDREFADVEALAGVDEIDWAEVPSCYGQNVKNFPRYLRALVSEVSAVGTVALGRIEGETLHQGTIYVATARVLPFVLRLLDHPGAPVDALLQYAEAVTSQAADYREQALTWPEDVDDRIAVLGTLQALEDEFARVAAHVESSKAQRVAVVLSLAARAGAQGEALLIRAAAHDHWVTAATAVHGLLDRQGEALTGEAAAPWLEHADPIVRTCAAIATVRNLGAAAPERARAVLVEALDREAELAPRFRELPFVKGTLLAYLALCLGLVRDERTMSRAVDLAGRLNDVDLFTLDTLSFGVLRLCFGGGTPPFAPGFIEVLAAIASCGRLENFANFSQNAPRLGLPSRASDYRALVEALRAAADPTAHMAEFLAKAKADDEEDEDEDEEDDEDEDDGEDSDDDSDDDDDEGEDNDDDSDDDDEEDDDGEES